MGPSSEDAAEVNQITANGGGRWILVDSGADDHVCPDWYAPHVEADKDAGATSLFDVQGRELDQQGCKCVRLVLGPGGLGKLLRGGCIVGARDGLPCLNHQGKHIPLALRRNSLCVFARFAGSRGGARHCAD